MFQKIATTAILVAISLVPTAAFADWVLDGKQSNINIVSVKKGKVGEVHSFKSISGNVAEDGTAKVEITLGSVETGIAIRNKRMGKMLFEISKFPLATITTKINIQALQAQTVGSRTTDEIMLAVNLHGVEKEMSANVIITRLSKSMVSVSSAQPLIVKAGMFGLNGGVTALQKVAKLPSIATAIPTSFNLVFTNK